MPNQPKWKVVDYSRNQIIKAGKIIKKTDSSKNDITYATQVIDNWRAAHAFPMHIIYMHLRRMAKINSDIIVAERLKRLDSIVNKLKREPTMSLWAIQDLGGCRFIVPTIEDVYKYSADYEKSRKRHILKSKYDYIKEPKATGYRSLHFVYEYKSDTVNTYNRNMLIEIQFRTHLQHLWATAVETMGLFTKKAIKSGQGDNDVNRFFLLTSALFSKIENQALPPNVVDDIDEIVLEIESLNAKHNYLDFLRGIRVATDYQEQNLKSEKMGYYILILNYNTNRLKIQRFMPSQFEKANAIYNSIERTSAETKIDSVLVNVSSFKTLKAAYPNYFSDIIEFINIVKKYLSV